MKITVIGGGPGGLYFSILVKKAVPTAQIDVFEHLKLKGGQPAAVRYKNNHL
ncbi:hypothetical protein SAMN02927903_00777 [Flavobacterium caeni]|uniref:Uncharacterized protein n=1 Tax=Flavobacterium caeni TaxID=490189 RepID=A0A1G5D7R4_9FLAO|nr:hypothetical protein SAMN02927903_00777 [Flavobacterium caeni]